MHTRRFAAIAAALTAFAGMAAVGLDRVPLRGQAAGASTNGAPALSRVQRETPLPASIDVVGEVVAHGGATSGTITVRVGTATTQASGTISPQFLATVPGTRASDMVTLEVQGAGFKYTSLLGTYGKLVARAGADRVLTLAESDALRVSPVSTALEFFVARRLGGTPVSDAQLEKAMRSVLGQDLVAASSALATLARGSFDLPAGFAHGYALLQDREAYSAFARTYPEATSYQELATMPFGRFDAASISRTVALLGPIADLEAPLLAPEAQVIEHTATGYLVHASDRRRDSGYDGALDADGALTLTPKTQLYYDTYGGMCTSNNEQVVYRVTRLRESHRVMRKGDLVGLRLVLTDVEQRPLNCPEYEVYTYTYPIFWMQIDLAKSMPLASARRFGGLRSLPHFCINTGAPDYLAECEYALHRFDRNGSGTALELGEKVDAAMVPVLAAGQSPFTWRIASPGVMRLDGAEASTRYWMLDAGNGLVDGLVYVSQATSGEDQLSAAGYAPMLNGSVASGFSSLPPTGTWRESGAEQYLEPYLLDDGIVTKSVVRVTRSADGTAVRDMQWPLYPEYNYSLLSSWQSIGGRVFDTRVRASDGRNHRDCNAAFAAGATQCAPFTVRYFRPMSRSGNVLYGIEELYTNLGLFEPPFDPIRRSRPAYQLLE
jgi:hypothetical protein